MVPETGLSAQMEDYLEVICELCREDGVARVKAIANRLLVTYPSVVGAIKTLKQKRLVRQERYGYIRLTPEGEAIAGEIIGRHEILTRFLVDILGLDPQTASSDACRIEHAVGPETIRRFRAVAEFIQSDPRINLDWKKGFQGFYKKFATRNLT